MLVGTPPHVTRGRGHLQETSWAVRGSRPGPDAGAQPSGQPAEISIRRSACFGRCPIYDFVLTRAGRARYDGVEWTTIVGRYRATVDSESFVRLTKFITDQGQASELATKRKLVTGNVAVDKATLAQLQKDDPLVYTILKTQLEHTDKMTGNWRFGNDSRIKEAFWPEVQSALLGRKDAKSALADADRRVSRELTRA